jgi:hypothetical protein
MSAWLNILFRGKSQEPGLALSRRFERKFFLPTAQIPFAAHLLMHCCVKDRQYHKGTIHSVYYDTHDGDALYDSSEGNPIRNKIRIRWYDTPQETSPTTPVFLELKSKDGFAGTKQRKKILVPTERLTNPGMRASILDLTTIHQTLFQFGHCPEGLLHPMIYISYRRLRFEDLLTGMRISLDWCIQSSMVPQHLNGHGGPLLMHGGVVEIKGPTTDIPRTVQSIRYLGTDWSRYSKFAGCLEAHAENPGSVGRVWPSGRVERV